MKSINNKNSIAAKIIDPINEDSDVGEEFKQN